MKAGKPNKNGRLYPRSVMENQVSKYQEQIGERRSLGELGHPPSPTINLDKVSALQIPDGGIDIQKFIETFLEG